MSSKFQSTFLQNLRDYLVITFGLLCYATGFSCFQLPYEITTGALAGAGAVIFYATGFPAQYTYLGVNVLLLIAAIKILGWKFCVKTVYAVFMLTFLLAFTQEILRYVAETHPGEYVLSPQGLPQIVKNGMFMSCILGAALEGIGIGLVFLNNGSTGGTDIIAAIINKYKDVTLGQMMMLCDVIIITSSLLLPTGNIERLLYGYCTLIITNLLLDYVVDRGRQSVQFLIFSLKYEEIAAEINKMHRGVTVLNGQGWYTKHERKVLVVLAKKRESTTIFRIIQNIDPAAFVSQSKVIGVFGYGFDKIKIKADKEKAEKETAAAAATNAAAPRIDVPKDQKQKN
ncbi:MAG: YitT family protein [Bacteroidales bacterium]|nr:YitT family protein [Bacteroidales bacterium]